MFQHDLAFGKVYEGIAHTLLDGETIEEVPVGAFKGWDFRTNKATYEVKSDRLAHKYGYRTMFIEYECSGKPSGISTTEADYWFYFMVNPDGTYRHFKFSVSELREKCKGCPSKVGGDGWRSRGFIVPVATPTETAPHRQLPMGMRVSE